MFFVDIANADNATIQSVGLCAVLMKKVILRSVGSVIRTDFNSTLIALNNQ